MRTVSAGAKARKISHPPTRPCYRCGRPVIWAEYFDPSKPAARTARVGERKVKGPVPVAVEIVDQKAGDVALERDMFDPDRWHATIVGAPGTFYRLHRGGRCRGSFTAPKSGRARWSAETRRGAWS